MKEIEKGFLRGPIDPESLPEGATLTRRVGVVQRDKVRPIDDFRSSMVNASVTQVETVSIHGVDHIAAMCSEYLRTAGHLGQFPTLMAKCWDLSAAYKQVPLSDTACHLDGYLVVSNPRTKTAEIYRQNVLPFGSIASVTAFLRCSLAIWHIGSTLLHFCWSSFFDDYLSICNQAETKHLDVCTALLFQLLGWRLSDEKLVPQDTCCIASPWGD